MLVPKLRFKKFKSEWNKIKLSTIVTELNEKTNDINKYPLWSLTLEDGVTPKTERYERGFLVKKEDNFKIVHYNNFVYNPMNLRLGAIAYHREKMDISVSGYYNIFKIKNNCTIGFWDNYFKCPIMIKRYNNIATGSLVEKKRVHYSQFIELSVPIPSEEEQIKISNLLILLDKKIKLQQRKIETLKMYKRGLMKRILKSNNWNELTLKQCCNGFDNLRKPITATQRKNGKIPYYGANGIQDFVDDYIINGEYILLAEDGGHFDEFMNKEIAQYILGKAWVNNHAHILQAKEGFNTKFIYYNLIHKDIRKYINGTSRSKLNQGDMWKINIKVPELTKQIEIAKILDSVDRIIIYENKKLSILVNLKKGFLERMFV